MNRFTRAAVAAVLFSAPVLAQLSSDVPGVPRASISMRGSRQGRTEWTLTGYKVPSGTAGGSSTIAAGVRLGFGSSYRIREQFELGYDFTFADLLGVFPPSGADQTSKQYLRGLVGYGIRIGGKWRPIHSLDLDGNGYEFAVGGAWQPALKPLSGIERYGDSSRSGGQFAKENAVPSVYFPTNPFAEQAGSTTIAVMGSYRARRFLVDGALMTERVASGDGPSSVEIADGVSLNVGGAYRLTPSIAIGGSYWGLGAPPWRDDMVIGTPGKRVGRQFAFLLQLGSARESGVDLMVTSPTGKLSESVRLYIRARATR